MTFNEWLLSEQNGALRKQLDKDADSSYWKGVFDGLDKVLKDRPVIIQEDKETDLQRVKRIINMMLRGIRQNSMSAPTIQLMGTREQKDEYYKLRAQSTILVDLYNKL